MKNFVLCAAVALSIATAAGRTHSAPVVPLPAAYSCSFLTTLSACGFSLQAKSIDRAPIETIDGLLGVRLVTHPGDTNIAGSGSAERADLQLSRVGTDCSEGREQWWAHSILFPDDYVAPPPPTPGNWTWGVVFDFHGTGPHGQANFNVDAMPDPVGLRFRGYGGNPDSPLEYGAPIGPVVRNTWYDFVYHVRWSAYDGFFDAWVNGARTLSYRGPTLYYGSGCYLKLANYHTPLGVPSAVIHARVIRGTSAEDVARTPLE